MSAAYQLLFAADRPGSRWFSIAAHRPFLSDLAFSLHAAFQDQGPEAMAEMVVFTPTRRAARELARAFVQAGDRQAVLLPQVRAIGDLDEGEPPFEPGELALQLAPAITPRRRRFELARLVADHAGLLGRTLDAPAALELADALAAFLDAVAIEEAAGVERLAELVEGELARHWQATARFLALATEAWPARLAELGLVDVAARRTELLRLLAGQWRASPPERPLVVAGVVSAAPAMAALLREAAACPHGCVVLPGLDGDLSDAAWSEVEAGHPQHELKRLLERAGVRREAVSAWPAPESLAAGLRARDRRRLVNEALRPAQTTHDWRHVLEAMRRESEADGSDRVARGLEGLGLVAAAGEAEAARTCALLLREVLETPGRTAALVTPDAALARRVSAELARWGVEVDSSGGAPLAGSAAGVLIGLAADSLEGALPPSPLLLAILKHPAVRLGRAPAELAAGLARLERRGLRGPRPADWAALIARLKPRAARLEAGGEGAERETRAAGRAIALAEALRDALDLAAAPFADGDASAPDAARAQVECLEALTRGPGQRAGDDLWRGPDGEAAATLLAGLIEDSGALPPCSRRGFGQLVRALLAGEVVRSGGRTHPRLRILGLIEARLIGADRLVLAGLEEGVWPAGGEVDPFLSRPMRERVGLPSPERRVGVAAHDFAQAACAPEVVMVTRERRGGQPAVMSRWLWRLQTLAAGADVQLPRRDDLVALARGLDRALSAPVPPSLLPAHRPAPTPPATVRPRQVSVTDVERLVRDPYAVYARRILDLKVLPRPDEAVDARARGQAIHAAFERFAEHWPGLDPATAGETFATFYMEALEAGAPSEALLAREAVLAGRAGDWVAALERERRARLSVVLVEQEGAIEVGGVRLTCRADRLELAADGRVNVLDFKTGRTPTRKEVETDFSPQLTLTAAIVQRGGFAALGPREPGELAYLRVSGRDPAGEEHVRGEAGESAAMADAALVGLAGLVERFAAPDTPYRSRVAPRFVGQHASDYDHLARVREWSAADEEDAE